MPTTKTAHISSSEGLKHTKMGKDKVKAYLREQRARMQALRQAAEFNNNLKSITL